ncbi:DNA polymerase phi-domain-containing protein [Dipodascopsis uninucleata]
MTSIKRKRELRTHIKQNDKTQESLTKNKRLKYVERVPESAVGDSSDDESISKITARLGDVECQTRQKYGKVFRKKVTATKFSLGDLEFTTKISSLSDQIEESKSTVVQILHALYILIDVLPESIPEYVNILLELSESAPWAKDPIYGVICFAASTASERKMKLDAFKNLDPNNLEGLAVLISSNFDSPDLNPLSTKNFDGLVRKLLANRDSTGVRAFSVDTVIGADGQDLGGNVWKERPHCIFHAISKAFSSSKKFQASFDQFWTRVVEKQYLTSNGGNLLRGYAIAGILIRTSRVEDISKIFTSKAFLASLLKQDDMQGNKTATIIVSASLNLRCKMDPTAIGKLMDIILESSLDSRTDIKAGDSLIKIASKSGESVETDLYECLARVVLHPQNSSRVIRSTALHYIADLLVASRTNVDGLRWKKDAFTLLLSNACFKPAVNSKFYANPEFSGRERSDVSSMIEVLFGTLMDDKSRIVPNLGITWSYFTLKQFLELHKDSVSYKPLKQMNPIIESSIDLIENLPRASNNNAEQVIELIELLLSQLACFVLLDKVNNEELEDVIKFSGMVLQNDVTLPVGSGPDKDGKETTESFSIGNQIAELVISLSTKKIRILTTIAHDLIRWFWKYLHQESLEPFYNVLYSKENLSGQNELFSLNSDDEDEESSSEQGEDEDEDEIRSMGDESEDDEDQNDEEAMKNDILFQEALSKLLKVPVRQNENDNDEDDEDEDEDDEDMDDDQMLALDDKLASMFKDRVSGSERKRRIETKKTLEKRAKEMIVYAKMRVIDLLTTLIRCIGGKSKRPDETGGFLIMSMIIPLLDLVKSTSNSSLRDRAVNILRSDIVKIDFELKDESTVEILYGLLNDVLQKLPHNTSKVHSSCISSSSTMICKILMRSSTNGEAKSDTLARLIDVYSGLMTAWALNKNVPISEAIFIDFIRWLSSQRLVPHHTTQ